MSSEPGPHPEDQAFFDPAHWPTLRAAVDDLSWLMERSYAIDGALKLVGDRYQLHGRQRLAARRVACSEHDRQQRALRRQPLAHAAGRILWIDGFNLLITLATAQRGGMLLVGRDGALRDLASSHRLVLRTAEMLGPIADLLATAPPSEVRWILDRPVSNSDRVGQMIVAFATEHALPWSYQLEYNPDTFLIAQGGPAVTSDAMILDAPIPWVDLLTPLVDAMPSAWVVRL